jgi:hypothetical protein
MTQPPSHETFHGDENGLGGARRLYIQRGPSGYGFLFSTNGGSGAAVPGNMNGMNHFVSRVDDGSPSAQCGLQLGDRILKVNDVPVLNMVHRSVVALIQESPVGAPLRLIVCTPSRVTPSTLKITGVSDTTSGFSDEMSMRSNSSSRAHPAQQTHPDHLRSVAIVIRNPDSGLLLAVKLSHVSTLT